MLILSSEEIKNLLPPKEIIEAVRQGCIKEANGYYKVPERSHVGDSSFMYLLMPAFGERYYGTKLVSVISANRDKGIPIVRGTMTLNRTEDGETVAFMDATSITAIRTGAVGALGLEVISDPNTSEIGVIGCGVQGIWQTIFATHLRPIQQVYCFTRSKSQFASYCTSVKKYCPDLELHWCPSADEVVAKSSVVYTCTTSADPVFSNSSELIRDTCFISVGSFRPDMQELPDVVYEQSEYIIIDSSAAIKEVGDVANSLEKKWIPPEKIIKLGDLLGGNIQIPETSKRVFKSVGMAAFDLAVGSALYEYARKHGKGRMVEI